jgi:hypothetical protein
MGTRVNRVPLSKVTFQFLPDTLKIPARDDTKAEREFQSIYDIRYKQVFGGYARHSVSQYAGPVVRAAKKVGCDVPMFITTLMVAHRAAYPDQEFNPGALVDNRAIYRVKAYRNVCADKFASLTVRSLDQLTGSSDSVYSLDRRMEASETAAGEWILKRKMFHDGPPYAALFQCLELQLDPNWLAIEPRYQEILNEHTRNPGPVSPVRAHRHRVWRAFTEAKRHKHVAIGTFRCREAAMPAAVSAVLSRLGYDTDDFEIERTPAVTDALQFWNRLGLAIQQFECLKLINGQQSIYKG